MAGQTSEDVTYKALAGAEASLSRAVDPGTLSRLAEVGTLLGPAMTTLAFAYHDRRSHLIGQARVKMELPCQWCEARLEREVVAHFEGWLAIDEAQAQTWDTEQPSSKPIIVAGETLDVPLLIEDELLLAVPGRVCTDEHCPNRPVQDAVDVVAERTSPFAGMADLIGKR